MTKYLLDTNVPSELSKPRPSHEVELWLRGIPPEHLYISVVSLAEIVRGIARTQQETRRMHLNVLFENSLNTWFHQRRLPLTETIANRLGALVAARENIGRPISFMDAAIAATALEHGLTLATRNIEDFQRLGLQVFNPWTGKELFS